MKNFLFIVFMAIATVAQAQDQERKQPALEKHSFGVRITPILGSAYTNYTTGQKYGSHRLLRHDFFYERKLGKRFSLLAGAYIVKQATYYPNSSFHSEGQAFGHFLGLRYHQPLSRKTNLLLESSLSIGLTAYTSYGTYRETSVALDKNATILSVGLEHNFSDRLKATASVGIYHNRYNGFHLAPQFGLQWKLKN